LFFGLLAIVALVLVAGLFLPTTAHVERSITTSASPDSVFRLVNGFARFNEWSPWATLDPQARYTYSGPPEGVGASMAWTSDKPEVGSGRQEIVAVEPGRSVRIDLEFDESQAVSTLLIEPDAGGGSRITWSFDTSFEGNFLGRYFGPLLDGMIGADYEKGLARLKTLAETAPPAP
jgi:uncharacterized protein YndB with AHSA1/START domain